MPRILQPQRALSRVLLLALILGVVFSGCLEKKSSSPAVSSAASPSVQSGSTLHVHLAGEPVTLDPSLMEDGLSYRIVANVLEGLVGYDGGGELKLRLAESYQVSQDGKRLEFVLRKNASWSDGRAVTAGDFVTGIRRSLLDTKGTGIPSKLGELLLPIRGAQAYRTRRSLDLPGVRTEGDQRLVIELQSPAPYFLQVLALPVAAAQREDILAAHGGAWPAAGKDASASYTGPYRIAGRTPDRSILLERNPYYWGGTAPVAKVEAVVVRDETTATHLFDEGRLDILTRVPTLDFPRLQKKGVLRTDPFLATYYLGFNCRIAPSSRRDWRRKVSAAIRREELAHAVSTGETPARSWVPPGLEGFIEWKGDAEMASALGSPTNEPIKRPSVPVEADFDSGSRNALVMEKVQQDLKKALGMDLKLSQMEWKPYIRMIQSSPPSIYRFGWLAPFKDPISHLQALTTGNPNNYTGCSVPAYDRLVKEIAEMPSGPVREAKIRQAESIVIDEEAVVAPLYHYVQNHAVSARLSGFRVNPFGVIRFEELQLK